MLSRENEKNESESGIKKRERKHQAREKKKKVVGNDRDFSIERDFFCAGISVE